MKKIAERIEILIGEYSEKIRTIPNDEFSLKAHSEKWSKKEILGHLVDSALNNSRRFVLGQYEQEPKVDYDGPHWVLLSNYRDYERENLVQLWTSLNLHICRILENMSAENYDRLCDSGDPELRTLQWLAEDYVQHMLHHLKQLT